MFNWLDKFLFPEERESTAEENEWVEQEYKPNTTVDYSFAGPPKYPSYHSPSGLFLGVQKNQPSLDAIYLGLGIDKNL